MPDDPSAWGGVAKLFSEFTPGAYGIWLTAAMVLVALVKAWPVLALQALQAREKIRGENRADLHDCQRRLDEMDAEVKNAVAKFHDLEMKLVGAITGYKILDAEVEANLPDSTALAQARAAMSTAFTISPSTPVEIGGAIKL